MEDEAKLEEKINAIAAQMAQLRAKSNADDRLNQLESELKSIRTEAYQKHKQFTWKIRFLGAVGSVLVPIAGFFGIRYSYSDIIKKVTSQIHAEVKEGIIQENNTFYDNLTAAAVLDEHNQFHSATDKLMKCFTQGHYHDTAVLVPLLWSLYEDDDWERAAVVIKEVRSDEASYVSIPDTYVYVLIGSIEIQAGLEHPDWLDDGLRTLNWAKSRIPENQTDAWSLIDTNLWLYHLQRKEFDAAQQMINSLKLLKTTYRSWLTVSNWRFFRDYLQQDPSLEPKVKAMWDQLPTS